MLDVEEYFHLAIHASKEGDHQASLEHLYKILAMAPDHLPARYLLAAEHAELGLYERACAELQEILRLVPEMATARLQLGLLALQLGRLDEAREAFSTLAETADDQSLTAFSRAYLHLLDERPEDAVVQLIAGIEVCTNLALKVDMERVLSALSSATESHLDDPGIIDGSSTVFLGAYRNSLEIP